MEAQNTAIVRRAVDNIWNRGELDLADLLFASVYVNHGGLITDLVQGPEAIKISVALFRAAFPELHITVEGMTAERGTVEMRWSAKSNSDYVADIAQRIDGRGILTGTTLTTLAGGKIVESWTNWDHVNALQRLENRAAGNAGMIPTRRARVRLAVRATRGINPLVNEHTRRYHTMAENSSTVGAAALGRQVAGNGAVPRAEGAPDLLAEVARLTEECETLRQVAAARAAELENLSQRKDEFIAIAAHDIKTPLTAILGYAQFAARLLAKPSPDLDKVGHLLAVVQDQGVMMTGLLEDLIDASRIQLGALKVQATPCDIGASLTATLSRLALDERERVDIAVPPTAVVGQWDQKRVEQLFANLIGNALKYSPDDSRVSVVITRHDSGIEVAVSDHGMGIPPGDVIRIFERFHRTTQAQASGRAGTGLGLYICRCIVAAHGGSLWAESPGEQLGATLRLSLPYQYLE